MTVTKTFDRLKSLQDILAQKYEIERKIDDAPKQLSDQEELLDRLKKEFIKKNAEYEEARDKVNQLRGELDDAIRSRESGEKGMDNISTHREYEALERQINDASVRENDIRKELQKEEKQFADLKDTLKQTEEMIKSQEAELGAGRASLDKELGGYNTELAALKKQENKLTPSLDREILFKFERIIQRNSEGIVAVRNGVCMGCHMILPAQFANEVHKGESILFCPYCSRILFYEEAADEEQEGFFKLDDAGSLADLDEIEDEDDLEEESDDEEFSSESDDDAQDDDEEDEER